MSLTAEQLDVSRFEADFSSRLVDCDNLPGLIEQRSIYFQEAHQFLGYNRWLITNNESGSVPLAVDVLGTARTLSRLDQAYGHESVDYQIGEEALQLDSSRLVAEARRKNTWEYFPEVFHARDPSTGEYYVNGRAVREVVVNGLSPLAHEDEQTIRVFDYVEQRTKEYVGGQPNLANEGMSLVTIKPCPDYVIKEHKGNPKKAHGGYVPAKEKLFIQRERFAPEGCYQEELTVSGEHITVEVMAEVLTELGGLPEGQPFTKDEIRSKQFLSTDADPSIDLLSRLDQKASEKSGLNIFRGEVVPPDHPKDYSTIRPEAIARQQEQQEMAEGVKDFLKDCESSGLDSNVASCQLDGHLKREFFELALENPEIAGEIFDEETAEGLKNVKKQKDADIDNSGIINILFNNAPPISYCGAGSCGLEEAINSGDIAKVRELGLTGDLLYDRERACPKCSQKTVYYSLSGGKACANCESSEAK